jgi:hypothetical protein
VRRAVGAARTVLWACAALVAVLVVLAWAAPKGAFFGECGILRRGRGGAQRRSSCAVFGLLYFICAFAVVGARQRVADSGEPPRGDRTGGRPGSGGERTQEAASNGAACEPSRCASSLRVTFLPFRVVLEPPIGRVRASSWASARSRTREARRTAPSSDLSGSLRWRMRLGSVEPERPLHILSKSTRQTCQSWLFV